MANRLAVQADVDNTTKYGDWIAAEVLPPMQVNDIIIDADVLGNGQIWYPDFSTTFSGARVGATIWIDSVQIAADGTPISHIGLYNTSEWDNGYMEIRPLRGQCHFVRNNGNASTTGYIGLTKFKKIAIIGEMNSYPGYRNPTSIFMTGTFGFQGSSNVNSDAFNCISIFNNETTAGEIYVNGFEVEHGFAGFRFGIGNQGSYEVFRNITVERCYRHDSISGEGTYFGWTGGEEVGHSRFEELDITNNTFVRTATEAHQYQHMVNDAYRSYIRNNMSISGVDWLAPFQSNQDNALQLKNGDGNTRITDNIFDGAGFSFWMMAGSATDITLPQNDVIRFRNNLMINGKGWGAWHHQEAQYGIKWEWIKNYFIKFNDWYENIRGENPSTAISTTDWNATDELSFIDNVKDTTRATWYERPAQEPLGENEIDNGTNNDTLLQPTYVQAGIDYTKYKGIWIGSVGNGGSNWITWSLDDIVTVFTDGVGTRFYKCISGHTSDGGSNPITDTGEWTPMTWDEAGIRVDEVGWETTDIQSNIPPDNFALGDDFWNEEGMGLSYSVAPSKFSAYKWYYADDATGTNKVQILYEKEATIDLTTKGNAWLAIKTGKYIVGSATPVDSLGTIGMEVFANGIVI